MLQTSVNFCSEFLFSLNIFNNSCVEKKMDLV